MSKIVLYNQKKNPIKYNEFSERISKIGEKNLCFSEISKDFLIETLELSDYLFVHTYNSDIRGFACVNYEKTPTKQLYISLICNTKFHAMKSRSAKNVIKYSGKNIINEIKQLGEKLKVKRIKLNAIDNVIPYYYNIGFTFENPEIKPNSKHTLIMELRKAQLDKNEEEIERILDKIVGRFYPGFYSETKQKEIGAEDDSRKVVARDDGIPMIFFFPLHNKFSICKGIPVTRPNKCKKMKGCIIAIGKKYTYCRRKKNNKNMTKKNRK
jgi:hypothetical protein